MKKALKIILIIAGVGALTYFSTFIIPSLMYYFGPDEYRDVSQYIELEDGNKVTLEELEKLAQKEGVKKENLSETEDSFVEITKKTEGNAVIYTDKTPEIFDLGFEKVSLKVVENKVYMNGVISTSTPDFFKKVFAENPKIDTLIMEKVDGSADDEANLKLAKWIAKKGLTFILEKNGDIASGGTDFFLAGKTRIIYKGAKIGVHSWSEGEDGKTAKDYPKNSKVHQPYIDYYKAIGFNDTDAKKFYYFTIDSATADGMHSMTEQEMIDYKITTEGKIQDSTDSKTLSDKPKNTETMFLQSSRWPSNDADIIKNEKNHFVLTANSSDTTSALETWKLYKKAMPYNKDWNFSVKVKNPIYWNTHNGKKDAQVGMGIFAGKPVKEGVSSKVFETNFAVINGGQRFVQGQLVANRLGEDPIDVSFQEIESKKEIVHLELTYTAKNHSLTLFADGKKVGKTYAIDSSGIDNWNLTENDTIDVGIMGFAENTTITKESPSIFDIKNTY